MEHNEGALGMLEVLTSKCPDITGVKYKKVLPWNRPLFAGYFWLFNQGGVPGDPFRELSGKFKGQNLLRRTNG